MRCSFSRLPSLWRQSNAQSIIITRNSNRSIEMLSYGTMWIYCSQLWMAPVVIDLMSWVWFLIFLLDKKKYFFNFLEITLFDFNTDLWRKKVFNLLPFNCGWKRQLNNSMHDRNTRNFLTLNIFSILMLVKMVDRLTKYKTKKRFYLEEK